MDDILREVAEEEKYDLKTLRIIWKSLLDHTRFLTKRSDECTLKFPHLGTAHVKNKYLAGQKQNKFTEKKFRRIREEIQHNIDHKQKPCLHRLSPKIFRFHYNKGKTVRQMEEIQNARASSKSQYE